MMKIPGCEDTLEDDVREWMNLYRASEPLGEDEIVAAIENQESEKEEGDSEDDSERSKQEEMMSHSDGWKCLKGALCYLEQQGSSQRIFYSSGDYGESSQMTN